jgi:hypothetical protein
MTIPTQFPELMAVAAAAGEGGLAIEPVAITRGEALSLGLALPTSSPFGDWTTGAFSAELRAAPGATGSPLATYSVSIGTPAGGLTPITLVLSAADSAILPAPAPATQLGEVFLGITFTPSGGSAKTIITTRQLVKGAI